MVDFFKRMFDFGDKVIVITGGLGLIGRQLVLAFAEYNGLVVVADIDKERFEELFAKIKNLYFEKLDISDPVDVESCIERIIGKWGKIDVWVNCAYPRTSDWGRWMDDITFDSWNKNIQAHLGGYFWTSKLVLNHMKKRRSGNLINFGSIYGMLGPNFDIYEGTKITMPVVYSAIKGGILSLTRYYAALYGTYNIRVNSICPGGVYDQQDDIFVEKYSKLTPLKRMARAYEIAMPVLFLASDCASYITGHTLMVDGGWSVW